MNRRNFLTLLGAAGASVALPALPAMPAAVVAAPAKDQWELFLERLKPRVDALVAREGRKVHRLSIEPPKASACGTFYVREVRVQLEAGGSLLQKCGFCWTEWYSSRWTGA